jgi:putative peptide zinc metalloprotease protein
MSTGMIASSFRSLPLKQRLDLECAALGDHDAAGWAVKDPVTLEYHRFEAFQYAVLQRLDGQRTLAQLYDELQQLYPSQHWTMPDLQKLVTDLHRKGLVTSVRAGQAETYRQRRWERLKQRLKRLPSQLLFTKFPGWNAYRTLDAMLPWTRWMYHPVMVGLFACLMLAGWGLILVQFQEFRRKLPEFQQFFGWTNLTYLWGTLAVTKLWHEFGHGLTCHYFGRRCHEMGVMLLLFTPTMYCDASDSWMLRNRWQRIAIGGGGMWFEQILAAIATFVWWYTQPGLINNLALNVVFVSAMSTVVFNLNPLMRYDGYYMLSDYLEIPNLRQKADRLLDRKLAHWFCGREQPADPMLPQHHETAFVAYSLGSTAYGWFISGSILMFLYSWLKPYELQSLGVSLAIISATGVIMTMGLRAWRLTRAPKVGSTHWGRVMLAWGLLLIAAVAVLWMPIPWYIEAAVIIEPQGAIQVFNTAPGEIQEIYVQPGAWVEAGQAVVQLQNPELEDQTVQLEAELAAQTAVVAAARARSESVDLANALERQQGLKARLQELRDQEAMLTIHAPLAGRVVPADPRQNQSDQTKNLPAWQATPLDPQNIGAWLDPRTPLLTIAPNEQLTAVLYLSQAHRDLVESTMPVRLKFDAIPGKTFRGELVNVSHEHAEYVPAVLSNKAGGPLATVTTVDQQEQLQELAYRATVEIDDPDHVLRTSLRGTARFHVANRTAAWWLSQTVWRTFRFRL